MYGQSKKHHKKQQYMGRAGNILKNNNVWTEQETSLKNNNVWTEQETS